MAAHVSFDIKNLAFIDTGLICVSTLAGSSLFNISNFIDSCPVVFQNAGDQDLIDKRLRSMVSLTCPLLFFAYSTRSSAEASV